MAITNYEKQKQMQLQGNAAAAQPTAAGANKGYNGLPGLSGGTAEQLKKYQQYKAGDNVQQAQKTWEDILKQKPQGYTSKYAGQLDSILQQIQNPGEFNYEFNGDNLFKSYADLYTQKGKQASLDAMGQAAGLTGGYGNSYAQAVGNQQYQQYLLGLYDKGMDLRDRAYQQYQDQIANNYNLFNTLMGADEMDYNRYRDVVGDWQRSEENAYNRYMNDAQMDRNNYEADREYWAGLAEIENKQYNTDKEREEAIRQYNEKFAEDKRQFDESLAEQKRQHDEQMAAQKAEKDQQYAYNYAMKILDNGKMPSAELLLKAGLSDKDAAKMIAKAVVNAGGRRDGGSPKEYYQVSDHYYVGDDGKVYQLDDLSEKEKKKINQLSQVPFAVRKYVKDAFAKAIPWGQK